MKMNKTKLACIDVIAVLLIVAIGFCSLGIAKYKADKQIQSLKIQLGDSNAKLSTAMSDLSSTQESLQIEVEKTTSLSNALETERAEYNELKTDLDYLKSEEYELAYMGNFRYTYYCDERYEHICGYGIGKTASGKPTEVDWTVAADTSVLPMGSIIYVEGIGFREVMDRGGGVKGNHIDILLTTHNECFSQSLTGGGVWVLVKKTS